MPPRACQLLYSLSGDQRLLEAFQESVRQTMQELEAEVKTHACRKRVNEERTTGNLVYGEFVPPACSGRVGGVSDPPPARPLSSSATTLTIRRRTPGRLPQFQDLMQDAPYWEAAFPARLVAMLVTHATVYPAHQERLGGRGLAAADPRRSIRGAPHRRGGGAGRKSPYLGR